MTDDHDIAEEKRSLITKVFQMVVIYCRRERYNYGLPVPEFPLVALLGYARSVQFDRAWQVKHRSPRG